MANVRVGFIGCGGIANGKHFPGMAQQEGVDMCAFCDLILERAEKAAKEYGTPDAKVYTDYHELLADPTIDAVHVLTPNVAHCEITVAALEAGKHVLCEKPMAATPADAKKMLEARDRTGKMLTISIATSRRTRLLRRLSIPAFLAMFTMQRLHTSAAVAFRPGAYSRIRQSRAAVR